MSLALVGREELLADAEAAERIAIVMSRGKAGLGEALNLLPLLLAALPDKQLFEVGGRSVTGAWLKSQAQAALADGKLDVSDLIAAIMAYLRIPQEIAVRPLPPAPVILSPAPGLPPVPSPLPPQGGTRPDGLRDDGQEAWLEAIFSDHRGFEDDVAAYVSGEKVITGPVSLWFMTGMKPQPSWVPNVPKGQPAPFAITHNWTLGDSPTYQLSSMADDGHKPAIPIFATPAGGKGIQMGDRWRNSDGWVVIVTLAPHHADGALPLRYWVTRDGTDVKSAAVTLMIAHA